MTVVAETRFWSKVDIGEPNECWEWLAGKYPNGYGQFWLDGRNHVAHRVAWTIEHGEIPEGLCVCHHCDNRGCVNPGHLFLGTHRDNTQDMIRKGRQVTERTDLRGYARGSRQHFSKLSEEDVLEIRSTYQAGVRGHGVRILAKQYGVRPYTIWLAVHRKTWTHI